MKNKIVPFLIAFALGFGTFSIANVAEAGCRWVPGHWSHGYWHPAHKVCWRDRGVRCAWRGGYWRHGRWHRGYRVCW